MAQVLKTDLRRAETSEVEKEITVQKYLEERGLNPQKYWVSVDRQIQGPKAVIKQGTKITVIPKVAGG